MKEMIEQIYSNIIYFLKLSLTQDVLWSIAPLFISTVIILTYFQKYRNETPGWEDYLSNSLVLLFVSISLFKYIYEMDIYGTGNFLVYFGKTIATIFLLSIGFILLKFNFEHILPQKVARIVSSVLTLHLFAYAIILFVYSKLEVNWTIFISLFLIIVLFSLIFNLIKLPLKIMFYYIEKVNEKGKLRSTKMRRSKNNNGK